MSYVAKDKDKEYDPTTGAPAKIHKIRITLTSSNVKNVEKCLHIFAVVCEPFNDTILSLEGSH